MLNALPDCTLSSASNVIAVVYSVYSLSELSHYGLAGNTTKKILNSM